MTTSDSIVNVSDLLARSLSPRPRTFEIKAVLPLPNISPIPPTNISVGKIKFSAAKAELPI